MIKEGMTLKLLEISILQNLNKMHKELPISCNTLFDLEDSYYKHIHFNFNITSEDYRLRPSFHFSNFTDVCQNVRKENGKTVCLTKYFRIELEDAIRNKEIEIISNVEHIRHEENLELNSLMDELSEVHKSYNQGIITEKELISKVIYENNLYCIRQDKWKNIVKPNFFIGGIASKM